MLTFEQTKAIEKALGPEAAAPVIEAIQSTDSRVMASLLSEVATKADLAKMEGATKADLVKMEGATKADLEKVRTDIAKMEGRIDARFAKLETMVMVLIGLAVVAIGMFSPVAAKLFTFVK